MRIRRPFPLLGLAALAAGLFCAPLAPARADLHFRGSRTPHAKGLRRVHHRLPAAVRRIPVYVWEIDGRDWPLVDDLIDMRGVIGLYIPGSARIYVRGDAKGLGAIFAHEMGHAAYFQVLTQAQRERWAAYWAEHRGELNRDYARTSAVEGFAEAFMCTFYGGTKTFGDVPAHVKAHLRTYFQARDEPGA